MENSAFYTCTVDSPVGAITITEHDGAIVHIKIKSSLSKSTPETSLLGDACRQLDEYFARERRVFDLPLAPVGTPFRLRVWDALRKIPYGCRVSYCDVARMIGSPRACRAVGGANHANPIPIIIPCHRVIGASGALVGFGGGLDVKKYLLDLESDSI